MPKNMPGALLTHLQGTTTNTCLLWRIVRLDGQAFYFTDSDKNVGFNGNTYISAVGYDASDVVTQTGLQVDNLEVTGFIDDTTLLSADLRAGKFDFADVYIYLVNWSNVANGVANIRRGKFGEVIYTDGKQFKVELRGMSQIFAQPLVESISPTCRADLGDSRCKMPISPPFLGRNQAVVAAVTGQPSTGLFAVPVQASLNTNPNSWSQTHDIIWQVVTAGTTAASQPSYNLTIGSNTTDGTAVLQAVQAWKRYGTVNVDTDNKNFTATFPYPDPRLADAWFTYGVVTFETGQNAGISKEVKAYTNATTSIQLFEGTPFPIANGDAFTIYAGCNLSLNHCSTKFNNVVNRRAEDYVPGQMFLLQIPSS